MSNITWLAMKTALEAKTGGSILFSLEELRAVILECSSSILPTQVDDAIVHLGLMEEDPCTLYDFLRVLKLLEYKDTADERAYALLTMLDPDKTGYVHRAQLVQELARFGRPCDEQQLGLSQLITWSELKEYILNGFEE
ncbi:hypothetical protein GMRT_21448 [Giardia muris]|uniref:EF-hand domain-containing protein n=1 Tax=Giardia muris TaxID=5742 RepID=A0A4Z1TBI0_GIAMU|nr:hypothetical protein GMRT_21448 [Giardia muris]|eukprot:TNJ30607.1 hypothetical protein GMRT_21448 [Giardia muris]